MPLESFDLDGKVVILTGGGGHIVGAMVEDLVMQGAHCVVGDIRKEKIEAQRKELPDHAESIDARRLDVTSESDWEKLLASVLRTYGRVDGLINGAGINAASTFSEIDIETMRRILEVNLMGTVLGCKVIGQQMVTAGKGSVINISSTASDPPLSRAFAYSASKSAVTNITKNIAREWGLTGVRVNALRPGFFPTEWNKRNFLTEERIRSILTHTPMNRFGHPNELCGAVQWLLSDASKFVTGAEVVVDGGFSCQTI